MTDKKEPFSHETEPFSFQKQIHDLLKKEGPAIYRHLGHEQDHLHRIIDMRKQDETIQFIHSLYLAVTDEAGAILRYDIQDTQEYLAQLKTKQDKTSIDRLENKTFKNVFFFSDYPDVFKEAKAHALPFVVITYVIK